MEGNFSEFDLSLIQNIINRKDQASYEEYVGQSKLREYPTISEKKDSGSKEFTRIVEEFSINSVKGIMPKTESAQQIVDSGRCYLL